MNCILTRLEGKEGKLRSAKGLYDGNVFVDEKGEIGLTYRKCGTKELGFQLAHWEWKLKTKAKPKRKEAQEAKENEMPITTDVDAAQETNAT